MAGFDRGRRRLREVKLAGRVVQLQVELRPLPSGGCTFELRPQYRNVNLVTPNRVIVTAAAEHLQRHGIALDAVSCTVYSAALGRKTYMYQLCRASPLAPQ